MEALMQYVWQFRLYPVSDMFTTDHRRVQVLDPGVHNHDAGPDFFNAKLVIGSEQWIGNVEIHVKASDWMRHHHDSDPAYDSVVLHVVQVDDMQITRPDGQVIPQLVMDCAPDFAQKYNDMVNNQYRELPCGHEIASLPSIYVSDWLAALAHERLFAKVERITYLLDASNHNWADTIYITLARALGFGTNSQPFELLARSMPLKHLLQHTDSCEMVEAMLFGQAGFLQGRDTHADPYVSRLVMDYNFLKAKFDLKPNPNLAWKMARMRPANFPHRRIAALAKLVVNNHAISNRMMEAKSEAEARSLFNIELSGYWASHYNFDDPGNAYSTKAFSYTSTTVLIINVVVPLMFAFAATNANPERQEFAVELLHSLKPECNRITEIFAHAGISPSDAFTTQAMIQLRREYCESRKCLFCRIGHKLLSQKVKKI